MILKHHFPSRRRIVEKAVERTLLLLFTLDVEASEIADCFVALGCAFVLALSPNYLHSSPPLQSLADHMGQAGWTVLFAVMGGFQFCAVLFGGQPSAFITDAVSRAAWYRVRRVALIASIALFTMIAILLCLAGSGWAVVLFGGLSLSSFWASMRLSKVIAVDGEVARLKLLRDEIKAQLIDAR